MIWAFEILHISRLLSILGLLNGFSTFQQYVRGYEVRSGPIVGYKMQMLPTVSPCRYRLTRFFTRISLTIRGVLTCSQTQLQNWGTRRQKVAYQARWRSRFTMASERRQRNYPWSALRDSESWTQLPHALLCQCGNSPKSFSWFLIFYLFVEVKFGDVTFALLNEQWTFCARYNGR